MRGLAFVMVSFALAACDGKEAASNVGLVGQPKSAKTSVLEAGAAALQTHAPLGALNAYLDGFHFYNGNMNGQMEAHHYCAILSEDLIQCVIFDGNVKDAKIMGVEYIVSERVFKDLPNNEKDLWHSHVHEVTSGQLVAPGIQAVAEKELMKKLISTYGKTFHTWHTDLHRELPIGVPQLMMGFTADGQADSAMVSARNKRLGLSDRQKKEERADIPVPEVAPGADAWQAGRTVQLVDPTGTEHSAHGAQSPAAKPTASSAR